MVLVPLLYPLSYGGPGRRVAPSRAGATTGRPSVARAVDVQQGWSTIGGTSASSPMWAGRAAVAGAVVNAAYVYANNITYRDITAGNNGAPCLVDFDLCSGRGSWTG